MISADYVVVGSGLTGLTIAHLLFEAGREVVVLERRPHLGGNVWDALHPSGIRMGLYGPHYFRTNSPTIWEFVNRFDEFYPFEARILTCVNDVFYKWPLHADIFAQIAGDNWQPGFSGTPTNFEEASLSSMPYSVYAMFVKGYTEKQWGVPASHLEPTLARRFDVRRNGDSRLSNYEHQGLPKHGYSTLVTNMLGNIPIFLGTDYLAQKDSIRARKKLIFTGSIDEYFGYSLGHLQYRAQRRSHTYDPLHSLTQPSIQVNYPDPLDGAHIRTIEWKHLLPASQAATCVGTVITTETPFTPTNPHDYEYPFPSSANREIFEDYSQHAKRDSGVLICGRLGEYRYYDMDQAIARAMMLTKRDLLPD